MNHEHLLIIVQNLPVPFDTRVWQEAQALANNGYKVSIICPQGSGFFTPHEFLNGIHIYRYPQPFEARNTAGYIFEYGWSLLWQFRLAFRVYFRHGFDVIHACNPPDLIFIVGAFFKYLFGKKFLFDHHDLCPELYEAKFSRQRGLVYKALLLFERLTFKTTDISIATNESYRHIALTRGQMPAERVFTVRSGPDLKRLQIMAPFDALKHGKKFLVGYVGVMGKQEGLEYLLEATRHIVYDKNRTDIHFTLIGNGPELAALKQSAKNKRLDNFVNFPGRIPDRQLMEILNTADVCVNPDAVNAMNDKSTMNKILEYMALAKPIVQFDVTEGRVSAGESSLYVRPADPVEFAEKILWLLDNPHKRETMGNLGRARIENELSWEYQVPNLLAAYEMLFSEQTIRQKLAWYYHHAKAMTWAEIPYRISLQLRRGNDHASPPNVVIPDGSELPIISDLSKKLTAFDAAELPIRGWQELRKEVYSGKFFLLAQKWPETSKLEKWHIDPVSGKFWPRDLYCFNINYRHAPVYGDVKYVWEINRMQYLQPLAALSLYTDDELLAQFCLSEIENWIDANPPYLGINWSSGLELALRLVSIIIVISFTEKHITIVQKEKFLQTIETHVHWIERYPSKYSSANNHSAAEGLAIFMAGTLVPHSRRNAHLQKRGWRILCEAARTLILSDGGGAEQSISYLAFTVETLMLGLYVAQLSSSEVSVPEYYRKRLESAGEFLRCLTDCAGNHPLIGDDDNGRVLGNYHYRENYVNSVLGALAAFTGRRDLNPPGNNAVEFRNLIFGMLREASELQSGVKTFHDSGMTIARHKYDGREIMIVFDHGPLGFAPLAAHGHADALAIWLHIDGEPVLVDAGTYLYHAVGRRRGFFRGTYAHNTICVDKVSASTMSGSFNWTHKAVASLVSSEYGKEEWHIEAAHDGYKDRISIVHRRVLKINPDKGFSVEDMLSGRFSRHADIGFLIHPSLTLTQDKGGFEIAKDNQPLLRIAHLGGLAGSIESSWYAPHFGEKIPAQRLVFSGTLAPGQKTVTKFYYL